MHRLAIVWRLPRTTPPERGHKLLIASLALAVLSLIAAPAAFAEGPPANTGLPVISPHEPARGLSVTTSKGSWTNNPTSYTYQWERCTASGGSCEAVPFCLQAKERCVNAADVGHTLRVKVTAKNEAGSSAATSQLTAVVQEEGVVTIYGKPVSESQWNARAMTAGPDGEMWVTAKYLGATQIVTVSPSGQFSLVNNNPSNDAKAIAAGPAGEQALWFTGEGPWGERDLERITTEGSLTHFAGLGGYQLVAWEGNVWVAAGDVESITPSGESNRYVDLGTGEATALAPGGGHMFAVHPGADVIERLGSSGAVTNYQLPKSSHPTEIVPGPFGQTSIFYDQGTRKLGQIDGTGHIKECSLPADGAGPIALGADHRVWFTVYPSANQSSPARINMETCEATTLESQLGENIKALAPGTDEHMWFITEAGNIGKFSL